MSLRRIMPLIALLIVLATLALFPVTIPSTDDTIVSRPAPPVALGTAAPARTGGAPIVGAEGEVVSGAVIQQQFPASGARIGAIALLIAPSRSPSQGTVAITVQRVANGALEDLTTQTIARADLLENQWYTLDFSPPLAVAPGQQLQVTMRTNGSPNSVLALWKNGVYQPVGYQLAVNNQPQDGTLRFKAFYAPRSGHLIGMLGAIWDRVTLFLGPLWRVSLLVGGLLLIASLGLVTRFLTR
jgi:hypothetical protein